MKYGGLRWTAGGLGLVALYAAVGFWGVPAAGKALLARYAERELGRTASVGELRFNPFTLRLQASDLRLRDRDGSELLALGGLQVEAQWRSVTRRAWSLAELRLVQPQAWLRIEADGSFNLARLLADVRGKEPPQPDAPLARVIVGQFAVEQGRVDFDDRHAGYRNVVAPVAFRLENFSTLPEHNQDHVFSARSESGGVLRWKGTSSLQPLRASGELSLENASLPELAVYLQPFMRATVAAGRLDAVVPYTFSYQQAKVQARLPGMQVRLQDLALAHQGAKDSFATLTRLEASGIDADLVQLQATVAQVKAEGGRLAVRRDARGELDLQGLMVQAAGPAAAQPVAKAAAPVAWKVAVREVALERIVVQASDETTAPPLRLDAGELSLHFALAAQQDAKGMQVQVSDARFDAAGLALARGAQPPLKLRRASLSEGSVDLQARRVTIGKVLLDGAEVQLRRAADGSLDIANLLPRVPASTAAVPAPEQAPVPAWQVSTGEIALQHSTLRVADAASGLDLQAQDIALALHGAGSELAQPVRFQGGFALRSGGKLRAEGRVVPATGALDAQLQVQDVALAPTQALLRQHVRLKLAGGSVSARGRLQMQPPTGRRNAPELQYDGGFHVTGLALDEDDGERFLAWKDVGAEGFRATLAPNRLDVPEMRVVGAEAKLIIEDDRSFNAVRLLVRPPSSPAPQPAVPPQPEARPLPVAATQAAAAPAQPASAAEPFPVRIRRVRLQDAKLDFADLSLRPQFAAKIYELNGAINGLSTQQGTRSQVELDGRVDEFGLARLRGEVNAFSPRDSMDLQAVFRNVDMVPASPYSMKFAGYRIAEGRISLDLQYKLKAGQLQGENQIVIDRLTLGERVDSPDAMKIPLQLAIAILKDSNGRIELGLPVSGSLDDPQFSYGALIWKAIANLLGKIVSAPFRALGGMLGVGGDKLEAIDFDPGSARLLPPEREKLRQVAGILGKRAQLKLAVPGRYDEAADGAALRRRALRAEVARRAGIALAADEEAGPMDPGDRKVRVALRELFAQRFGKDALEKEVAAVERNAKAPAAGASAPSASLPLWQRAAKLVQGEPQVADAAAFYATLQRRLEEGQALPAGTLPRLAEQRAAAIVEALVADGVAAERASAAPVGKVEGSGKIVPLGLELSAR